MTKLQTAVLIYCMERKRTFAEIAERFNISVDELVTHVLVDDLVPFLCSDTSADDLNGYQVWANNAGISFVEYYRKDNRRFRIPVVISVFALVISIAALCVSIWL